MTITTRPHVGFDTDIDTGRTDDDSDYSGWFCVKTRPFPCPADGCTFVADYLTAAHLIVVWPRNDDPAMLAAASNSKKVGRDPRVVEYDPSFGYCIPWDVWERAGRPIHGMLDKPIGWDENARSRL